MKNLAWVVLDVVATPWPWPASSTYAFSEAAGMLLKKGMACWLTGAVLSFWGPMIIVGSAWAEISVPPPPIEWPDTARRDLSMRLATELELASQVSAARCWVDRAWGMSKREFVFMTSTTKPWEAMRGPTQV